MPPIKGPATNGAAKIVNRGGAGLLKQLPKGTAVPAALEWKPSGKINNISPSLKGMSVDINTLVADPMNAREHGERSLKAIMESLDMYGQVKLIVVRKKTRVVVAGNGTMEAARALGWTKIAANIVDMTELEAAGYGLADNRVAEMSSWNLEAVAKVTKILEEAGSVITGWSAEELYALRMQDVPRPVDPDKVPEPPATPVSQMGDLWLLGSHRLLCGDSTSAEDVATLMQGKQGVLMATDPPYGVDFEGQKYNPRAKAWDGIKGDKQQGADLTSFMGRFLEAWKDVTDEQAAFYFWTAPMQEGYASMQAIKEFGLHIQSQIIWVKNVLVLGQSDFQWRHENAWYCFWKGKKHRWYGGRDKTSVWDVKKVNNADYLHPMQKPVELYEMPLGYHTKPGDLVVEPFSGSGTQLIACQKLARVCYAMEMDPVYVDVALERWAEFTGQDPVRKRDGKKFSKLKAAVAGK